MPWANFLFHTVPDLPVAVVFTKTELIVMFGRYNNRKGDGPPGNINLWRRFLIVRDRA